MYTRINKSWEYIDKYTKTIDSNNEYRNEYSNILIYVNIRIFEKKMSIKSILINISEN